MSQMAAYALKQQHGFNLAEVEQAAQSARLRDFQLQAQPGQVEATNARNENVVAKEGALADYRMAVENDQPDPVDELAGFPDIFKPAVDAMDGMDPKTYLEATKKARAMGEAAKRVRMFKAGTPEQKAAWEKELGDLMSQGYIDKPMHDGMVTSGPDDAVISEALDLHKVVDIYDKKKGRAKVQRSSALEEARIKDIDADNTRADKLVDSQVEKNKRVPAAKNQDRMSAIPGMSEREYGNRVTRVEQLLQKRRAEGATEDQLLEEELRLNKRFGLDALDDKDNSRVPQEGDVPVAEAPDVVDAGEAGTAENPHRPTSREEAEALPPGAYFMTPSGKLIRKK
jgi:hypothetical protein